MHNVYANTVCLEHAILSALTPSHPKYTISWKPHLPLLIGMGRGSTYILKFITLACEFLNCGSCSKLQGLAERYKIFLCGPNNIFTGFHNRRWFYSCLWLLLLSFLPSRWASYLSPALSLLLSPREEWQAVHTEVDILRLRDLFTFPWKSMREVVQERKAELTHVIVVLQAPLGVLSFMTG